MIADLESAAPDVCQGAVLHQAITAALIAREMTWRKVTALAPGGQLVPRISGTALLTRFLRSLAV